MLFVVIMHLVVYKNMVNVKKINKYFSWNANDSFLVKEKNKSAMRKIFIIINYNIILYILYIIFVRCSGKN